MSMVAALFVETNSCYFGLPEVDPWDVRRDARAYAGPMRVVAHPPCARWGRYWGGAPWQTERKKYGQLVIDQRGKKWCRPMVPTAFRCQTRSA